MIYVSLKIFTIIFYIENYELFVGL